MPRILITTSHRPAPRTRSFIKDLAAVIPNTIRFTRGKSTFVQLAIAAHDLGAERVVIVNNRMGNPYTVDVYQLRFVPASAELFELEKICRLVLRGITLSREARNPRPPYRAYAAAYVVHNGAPLSVDAAECFIRGLMFQAYEASRLTKPFITAVMRWRDGFVEVVFRDHREVRVGPVIRIRRVILCTEHSCA